jgi:hypothetical protein
MRRLGETAPECAQHARRAQVPIGTGGQVLIETRVFAAGNTTKPGHPGILKGILSVLDSGKQPLPAVALVDPHVHAVPSRP